ncbi:MAG: porin family protein [Bacteroidales bacterium]|jgi:hypothetical protein
MAKLRLNILLLVCFLGTSFIPCYADNYLIINKKDDNNLTTDASLSPSPMKRKSNKKGQSDKQFQIGIELGGNMSSIISSKDYQNSIATNYAGAYTAYSGFGFQGGVYGDFNLSENISLECGLYFIQKPYKENVNSENVSYEMENTIMITTTTTTEIKYSPIYLQVPILFKVNFHLSENASINLKAGPYFAFGLGGKIKINTVEKVVATQLDPVTELERLKQEVSTSSDYFDGYEKSDIGLKAGLGFEFSKITCGLFMDYGLMNILIGSKENMSANNFSLGLNVGYKF